ncbi:MAG: TonB-dependent receptor, partial [Flavobacteriia bacterium]|nr:TonB-dependent receptor [Flavobacteriia bacterium]
MSLSRFLLGVLCTLSISASAIQTPSWYPQSNPLDSIESEEVQVIGEVMVEATRTNRSIANVPTRTEVLTDEIDEAASMEPSQIAHLITHSTGIQVQTTSATSNGAVVRIQGLNGRYTQMLKDGFPLYGGFSGSLDVMQIPPLDLRQVEYIKGSASTLYGGGAIGGLINLLTKRPTNEQLLHINRSTIGAQDINLFLSRRQGKWGYTTLISRHLHSPYDADGDSFSDVPSVRKWAVNPKLFFYPNARTEFWLGAQIQLEDRVGGDLSMIRGDAPTAGNFYLDSQNSQRVSTQALWRKTLASGASITAKNALNQFDRELRIRPAFGLQDLYFAGRQRNSYTEVNYAQSSDQASLNVGVNVVTDQFEEFPLTSTPLLRNQQS